MKEGGSGAAPPGGRSGHLNHAHGVGVTGAGAPAGQDDHHVSGFEEASRLAWKLNNIQSG